MRVMQPQRATRAPNGTLASTEAHPWEEFSPTTRWMHWLRMLFITYLLLTGFEIANPFLQTNLGIPTRDNFLVGLVRGTHEMVGFALIAVTLVRIYTAILAREWRDGRVCLSGRHWASQVKYYLLLQREERNVAGRYGPLQFVTYAIFYVLLVLIALTGWLLYGANYHAGLGGFAYYTLGFLYPVFGGLAGLRSWHHWLALAILLFVVVHVYMAIWNAVQNRDGTIENMIVGFRRAPVPVSGVAAAPRPSERRAPPAPPVTPPAGGPPIHPAR